jgi:hypothetical protein
MDRDLIKVSTKKRGRDGKNIKKVLKFIYTDMYDGVHASESLKSKWFSVLCRSALADMADHSASESSTDDDEDSGKWDFKRHKED